MFHHITVGVVTRLKVARADRLLLWKNTSTREGEREGIRGCSLFPLNPSIFLAPERRKKTSGPTTAHARSTSAISRTRPPQVTKASWKGWKTDPWEGLRHAGLNTHTLHKSSQGGTGTTNMRGRGRPQAGPSHSSPRRTPRLPRAINHVQRINIALLLRFAASTVRCLLAEIELGG